MICCWCVISGILKRGGGRGGSGSDQGADLKGPLLPAFDILYLQFSFVIISCCKSNHSCWQEGKRDKGGGVFFFPPSRTSCCRRFFVYSSE